MIKKIFHYLCVLIAGALFSALLLLIYQQLFLLCYQINLLAPQTYASISNYWNDGGVIHTGDIFMLLGIISYFPIVFWIWRRLAKYQYMNLIMKPLSWISNRGLDKYSAGMPEVNIKNLKIEEKKTIEQLVQERIELENKKNPQKADSAEFRKEIVEKIENEIN